MVHNSSDGFAFQVKILEGPSDKIIPQLKKKYEVDTLDFVFLDHWKDRYTPDTIQIQVSLHNSSLQSKAGNALISETCILYDDLILCKMKNGSPSRILPRKKKDLGDRIPNFC